jgi:hypothetical protein
MIVERRKTYSRCRPRLIASDDLLNLGGGGDIADPASTVHEIAYIPSEITEGLLVVSIDKGSSAEDDGETGSDVCPHRSGQRWGERVFCNSWAKVLTDFISFSTESELWQDAVKQLTWAESGDWHIHPIGFFNEG